jgi:hypothetical protein
MLVTAIAIKLPSPGPVIFRQTRLGKGGHHFLFMKFRSMTAGNDDRVHREYVLKLIDGQHDQLNQGKQGKPLYKLKNDSPITPVGRIIRKLSIDELPQFFNVLKGDMSLVGPRPPIPCEVEKYKSWHLPPYPGGQTRPHRPLAGGRPQPDLLQRHGPAGHPLRTELVSVAGHQDPVQNRPRSPAAQGRGLGFFSATDAADQDEPGI